jgi:O-antigen ligase
MLEYNNDINTTYRVDLWEGALRQFKTNPIFGDSFINNVGNFYSHNIIMDVLMSVGIVGSIPFFIYFLAPFYYLIRLPSEKKRAISVLFVVFLAALMLYMTSGGLFTAAEFWILSAAVIGISQEYLKRSGEQ